MSIKSIIDKFISNFSLAVLRTKFRTSELGVAILGALIGACSGAIVAFMSFLSHNLHYLLFGVPNGASLSGAAKIAPLYAILIPALGGILMGINVFLLSKFRKKSLIDPIEANALYGGNLYMFDSIIIAAQNIISNGFGASVGLEAGYTQIASSIGSKLARFFKLRRIDVRVLVGCGASGAIAAAFNSPFAGSFYAFEVIIASYSTSSLAPVAFSALLGAITARALGYEPFSFIVSNYWNISTYDLLPAIFLGTISASFGIIVMKTVAFVEDYLRKSVIPSVMRPAIGGILVGLLAVISPQALSSGHGALPINLKISQPLYIMLLLLFVKASASTISIGSGFRGGLFFSSLFLGALLGKIFGYFSPFIFYHENIPIDGLALIGMGSLGAAIIGSPLAMTFLILEITKSFSLTLLALVSIISTTLTIRNTFNFSFATWRFHIKGENIRSAHDIGWVNDIQVNSIMRTDMKFVSCNQTIADVCKEYPLVSNQKLMLVDDKLNYLGMVSLPDVHGFLLYNQADEKICKLAVCKDTVLYSGMNISEAIKIFDEAQSDVLAVLDNPLNRKAIGFLTESFALRRYNEELDNRNHEILGQQKI